MASTSETGHAKNVASFKSLISYCTAYGTTYVPSRDLLKIAALNAQLASAQDVLAQLKVAEVVVNKAINTRADVFRPLRALATKLVNALDSAGATAETVKDARTINRKLQGQRAVAKPEVTDPNGPVASNKTISVSQQSYDQLEDHFAKLIQVLALDTKYAPNETELKAITLQTTLVTLGSANNAVINTHTSLTIVRTKRDDVLYNALTGLVAAALGVKKYIKSSGTAAQFKQVDGLPFRTIVAKE